MSPDPLSGGVWSGHETSLGSEYCSYYCAIITPRVMHFSAFIGRVVIQYHWIPVLQYLVVSLKDEPNTSKMSLMPSDVRWLPIQGEIYFTLYVPP